MGGTPISKFSCFGVAFFDLSNVLLSISTFTGNIVFAALAAVLALFARSNPCLVNDAAPFDPSLAIIFVAADATRRNPLATRIQLAADMVLVQMYGIVLYGFGTKW